MVRTSCKQQDAAVPQHWIAAGATMIAIIAVGPLFSRSLIAQAEPLPQPKVGQCPGGMIELSNLGQDKCIQSLSGNIKRDYKVFGA
jgi:hypothetical protein